MVEVIETSERLILVCNYKREIFLVDNVIKDFFPNVSYSHRPYREKYAIYLDKDSNLNEYNNPSELQTFINGNISRIAS